MSHLFGDIQAILLKQNEHSNSQKNLPEEGNPCVVWNSYRTVAVLSKSPNQFLPFSIHKINSAVYGGGLTAQPNVYSSMVYL